MLLTEFVLDRLYNIDLYIARTQKVSRASFESLRVQFLNEKKFAFRCFIYAIRGIRNLSNLTESIKQKLQKLTINSNIYVLCQVERRKKFINYSLHLNLSLHVLNLFIISYLRRIYLARKQIEANKLFQTTATLNSEFRFRHEISPHLPANLSSSPTKVPIIPPPSPAI